MFWATRKTTEIFAGRAQVHIHPTAEIGADVEIGPFTYIGPNCRVGDGCRLHNSVTLAQNTVLGAQNEVFPHAVLGARPQDEKYAGEESWVVVGDRNRIRESVTIHGGTHLGGGVTRLGSDNLLMAGCHIAHDCLLEDHITIANGVLLGGHVKVGSHAGLGGLAAVHHFVTIGEHAFVGGLSRVSQDVPPFMLVEGNPVRVCAVNTVGLKRSQLPVESLAALKEAHRLLFREGGTRATATEVLRKAYPESVEIGRLLVFLEKTSQGRFGRAREAGRRVEEIYRGDPGSPISPDRE